MRRRTFLSAAAGVATGAATLPLLWPRAAAAGLPLLATSLPLDHPAVAALSQAMPLRLVAPDAAADAELLPATALAAGRPALAILAALPFGPTPDRLAPWLLSPGGRALWQQAAGPALLPVWAAPGAAPRFAGSDLYVLQLADAPGEMWLGAAQQALGRAAQQAASPVTASAARINAGNHAADMVERLAAAGDPLTRACLSAMRELAAGCGACAGHHPLMEIMG